MVNRLRDMREISGDNMGQDEDTRVMACISPFMRPYQPRLVQEAIVVGIIREQCPTPRGCVKKLACIGRTLAPFFIGRRDVVPAINEEACEAERYVLVEIERRHLRGTVRGEPRVNRSLVMTIVRHRRIHGLP